MRYALRLFSPAEMIFVVLNLYARLNVTFRESGFL